MNKKLIFFTLRDFSKDGGGSLRIKGILNSLAKEGLIITLISKTDNYSDFNKNIRHIPLDIELSKKEKTFFQLSLALFPIFLTNLFFLKKLKFLKSFFSENCLINKEIIFFENLDNSFGYYLKHNNLISGYINDIHGIAPIEFKEKKNNGFIMKTTTFLKYIIVKKLDNKTFNNATGLIFVSKGMKAYFESQYPNILNINRYILQDGVSKEFCNQVVDYKLLQQIKEKYKINNYDKIVFFAGAFKDLGGVIDLIDAFHKVSIKIENIKLFLIGEGEKGTLAKEKVKKYNLEDKVVFAGLIPYNKLKTYQQLSNVIVCPDISHPYSEIVPHVKYFDSLASGKTVINGTFSSINEINKNESLSLGFEPSNINDLAKKIIYSIEEEEVLLKKYKHNSEIVCNEFTYEATVNKFLNMINK